jgi:hypothetical protein
MFTSGMVCSIPNPTSSSDWGLSSPHKRMQVLAAVWLQFALLRNWSFSTSSSQSRISWVSSDAVLMSSFVSYILGCAENASSFRVPGTSSYPPYPVVCSEFVSSHYQPTIQYSYACSDFFPLGKFQILIWLITKFVFYFWPHESQSKFQSPLT